jgi:hypothetical protein
MVLYLDFCYMYETHRSYAYQLPLHGHVLSFHCYVDNYIYYCIAPLI